MTQQPPHTQRSARLRRRYAVGALAALSALAATAAGAAPATRSGAAAGQRWVVYQAPYGLGESAGEPSIGLDPRTGVALFQAGEQTLRVDRFGTSRDRARWRDVSAATTSIATFDPILRTDPRTGRTFVSQLTLACSLMAFTDDDGTSWTDVPLGCAPDASFDHQTVGVGPFRQGTVPSAAADSLGRPYPNAVYYCAQDTATAKCGVSVDGGLAFSPGVVAYSTADCGGGELFGHLASGPDGTLYLPPIRCGSLTGSAAQPAAVAVSEDNGVSWAVRTVPRSSYGDAGHPSVAVGRDGTAYLAWGSGPDGGPVEVAVSRDHGRTWSTPKALGRAQGVWNSRFPVVVAGDGDRATVAYLGAGGGDANDPLFDGTWYLYASTTYDRGRTWHTVDVDPGQPVQVGSVCTLGLACDGDRNLLDFNDGVLDSHGYPWLAFADGCAHDPPCSDGDRQAKASIARLVSGRSLYRRFDRH